MNSLTRRTGFLLIVARITGLRFTGTLIAVRRLSGLSLLAFRILIRLLRRILTCCGSNFSGKLIGKIFDFGFCPAERFFFTTKHGIRCLFDAFRQLVDPLSRDLFGFLSLSPQAAADQQFGCFQCFFRTPVLSLTDCVVQPSRQQRLTFFRLLDELFRLIKNTSQIVTLLGNFFFQSVFVTITAKRRLLCRCGIGIIGVVVQFTSDLVLSFLHVSRLLTQILHRITELI